MVYFAVLLILAGLLILLLAFFSESGTGVNLNRLSRTGKETPRVRIEPEDMEIPLPDESDITGESYDYLEDEDLFVDFSMDDSEPEKRDLVDKEFSGSFSVFGKDKVEFREDPQGEASGGGQAARESLRDRGGVNAVLFDDRSNMIDYDSGSAVIDASVEGYKNIKRTGSGVLRADKDGLSFYIGESLHRFDFYRIFDVWSGENYIALPLKGSGNVKLFLMEKGSGLPEKVEKYFQEYTKG